MAAEMATESYDFVPLLYAPQIDGYDDEGVELFKTDAYDLKAAEVNIIEKLNSAKLKDKAAGATFINTATSISITTTGKIIYYETVNNIEKKYKFNGTTKITPENGSTKRYALIYNTLTSVTIGAGAECIAAVVTVNFDKQNLKQYYYKKGATGLPQWTVWSAAANKAIIFPDNMLSLKAWTRYSDYAQVVFPNGIKSIPAGTVYNMHLNIGTHVIPESVSSIDASNYNQGCGKKLFIKSNAFFRWYKRGNYSTLSTVKIGENVTDYILDENGYLFYVNGDKKELLWVDTKTPIIKIPEGLTFLQHSTFMNCKAQNAENIVLPNFLTKVPSYLFCGCSSLTSVTIRDSVTSIETYAFNSCSSLTSITIGNSVTSIGNHAFNECTALELLSLKNSSIKKLNDLIFYRCYNLISVEFPDSLEEIDNYTCAQCSNLEYVRFGSKIIKIGANVFNSDTNLTTVVINAENPPELNASAFSGCRVLNNIYVPNDSVDTYKAAAIWSTYADKIKPISERPQPQ
jgi:hypothetical protein